MKVSSWNVFYIFFIDYFGFHQSLYNISIWLSLSSQLSLWILLENVEKENIEKVNVEKIIKKKNIEKRNAEKQDVEI
jgi:hypothetical protein